MKITALMENAGDRPGILTEHGLSIYVETDRHKILFDSGQSDAFVKNAETLGIRLDDIDTAVLSHGHFDHSGGLKGFLEVNQKAEIYMQRGAFIPHYNPLGKYIGVDLSLQENSRIHYVDDSLEIDEELKLETYHDRSVFLPVQTYGMTEEHDGVRTADRFLHEQYLIVKEGSQKVLLSGCSHRGIYNIIQWAADEQVQTVIGGFHFMKLEPGDFCQMDSTAEKLLEYPVKYYTCHCTGLLQYQYLKEKMGDRLRYLEAGHMIMIS